MSEVVVVYFRQFMKTNHQINFMQQSAGLVVNPNIGLGYGFLFNSNMLFKPQTQ